MYWSHGQRLPKKLLNADMDGIRGRGRPHMRYLDSVKNYLNVKGFECNNENESKTWLSTQ